MTEVSWFTAEDGKYCNGVKDGNLDGNGGSLDVIGKPVEHHKYSNACIHIRQTNHVCLEEVAEKGRWVMGNWLHCKWLQLLVLYFVGLHS